MPPPMLIDPALLHADRLVFDHQAVYARMPHRFEFELLDGVCHLDRENSVAVAYRDCRLDEWWVRGHVPGRPIFPGVLQLEAGAQLVAFLARYVETSDTFVGFGGVDACRFREAIIPPARLFLIAKLTDNRPRRVRGDVQGVVDGRLVFESQITGLAMPDRKG